MLPEELIKELENGITVYGHNTAKAIRLIQRDHPDWVDIVDDMSELEEILGKKFGPGDKMPYFGAILTAEGKKGLGLV